MLLPVIYARHIGEFWSLLDLYIWYCPQAETKKELCVVQAMPSPNHAHLSWFVIAVIVRASLI